MRLLFLALLALHAVSAFADDDGYKDPPAIQRYLAELQFGDSLKDVQRIYPPAQDWPSHVDSRGRVTRYRVERAYAKKFPMWTQTLVLGFKRGKLVDIQVIYSAKRTGERNVEELARDLSLTYGEGERTDGNFWWADTRTVLRVFSVDVPMYKNGERGVERCASIQVLEKDLYKRTD